MGMEMNNALLCGGLSYDRLTPEELAAVSREGDDGAMDYLLAKYKPLVLKMARARFLDGGDKEDLIQEGMIGLYKAVRDFDPSKEIRFITFAGVCIDRQMLHAIEAAHREKNRPLNTSILLEDGAFEATASLAAGDQDPESLVISQEMLDERMKDLTDSLSAMEKEVLSGYLSGMSTGEIASRLGKTPKSVDNALQRIRKKTRFQKNHKSL